MKQNQPKNTAIIRQKMSRALTTGYECAHCGVMTVTYDGSAPANCQNCGEPNPVKKWQDIVTNITTIEKVM